MASYFRDRWAFFLTGTSFPENADQTHLSSELSEERNR